MNLECEWQVGYSGTVNIIIPSYDSIVKYSPIIESDYDEIIGSYFALTGTYPNSKNEIHKITKYEDIITIFLDNSHYNVLIDACAFLKDKKNEVIAEMLFNVSSKRVIYLTENDDKMIYFEGNHILYTGIVYNSDNVIYYYSQKHIIGVDFKQPNILNGLVLINDSSNYTQIAQAIYRMRKLNKGHVSHIGYCGNDPIISELIPDSKIMLYNKLVENDIKNKNNSQNLSLLLTFKHVCRKYLNAGNSDRAIENFLIPLYKIPDNETFIYNIIIDNFVLNMFMPNTITHDIKVGYGVVATTDDLKFMLQDSMIKFRRFPAIFDDVVNIFEKIKNLTTNELLSILYDIDDGDMPQINVEINIQQEQIVEAENNKEIQISRTFVLTDSEILKLQKIQSRFYYNPISKTINTNYKWFSYLIDGYSVIFSTNLLMVLPNDVLSICIVRLSNTEFLIENIYVVEFYYDKLPIYTMDGMIMNKYKIPEANLYATDVMSNFVLNLPVLFNVNIVIDTAIFCMGNLIGIPSSINNINLSEMGISEIEMSHVFTLFVIINTFVQMDSTASGITDVLKGRFLNIDSCVERINSFDDDEYQIYIRPINEIDFNKSTITKEYNYVKYKYTIDYIYFSYNNEIKKRYNFESVIDMEGGEREYKKYLKYKYKYLELKKLKDHKINKYF